MLFLTCQISGVSFQNWAKCQEFREKSTSSTISPLNMCLWIRTLVTMCRPIKALLNALRGKLNTHVVLDKS